MNIAGGYTQFPNSIQSAMPSMRAAEVLCTRVLVRETYGYHCRQVRLTYEDFQRRTGIRGRATIAAGLKAIAARGFFRRTGRRSWWEIGERCEGEEGAAGAATASNGDDNGSSRKTRRSGHEERRAAADMDGRAANEIAELKRMLTVQDRKISRFEHSFAELFRMMSLLMRLEAKADISDARANSSEGKTECSDGGSNSSDGMANSLDRKLNSSDGQPNSSDDKLNSSIGEANSSDDKVNSSVGEPNSSIVELNGTSNSSINESKGQLNGIKGEPNGGSNSSIAELKSEANSSISEPLPLYKEKSPSGKERERGGKRLPPLSPPPNGHAAAKKARIRTAPHPEAPAARTDEERDLAGHPATAVWLDAGMAWPGWKRLKLIARRMGTEPQVDALRKARDLWLMAGYREGNIGGILDWYEAICGDAAWQPYVKTTGNGREESIEEGGRSPTMKMLLKMSEDRRNGK